MLYFPEALDKRNDHIETLPDLFKGDDHQDTLQPWEYTPMQKDSHFVFPSRIAHGTTYLLLLNLSYGLKDAVATWTAHCFAIEVGESIAEPIVARKS